MVSLSVVNSLDKAGLLYRAPYDGLSRLYKSDFGSARTKVLQPVSDFSKIEKLAKERLVSCTGIVQDYWINVHKECCESQKILYLVNYDDYRNPCANSLFDLACTGYVNVAASTCYVVTLSLRLDSILSVLAPVSQEDVRSIVPYEKLSYRIMHDMHTAKNIDALRWLCDANHGISEFFNKVEWYVAASSLELDTSEIMSAIKYCILYYATSLVVSAGDVLYRDAMAVGGKLVVKAQHWDSLLVAISGYEPPEIVVIDGIDISVVKCSNLESYAQYLSTGV